MGYNLAVAILPDSTLDDLGATGAVTSFDEAYHAMPGTLSAAQIGQHVVIADPMFGEAAKMLVDGSRQLYIVILGSTVDQYVVQAVGPIERLRVVLQDEVVEDEGEPLPAEAALAEAEWPEDGHILVIERLLGASFAEVLSAEFRLLAQSF
jgi:hypothetical protein